MMESQQYLNEFPDVELEEIELSLKEKLHNLTQIHQDIESVREELTEEYKKSKNALDEIEKRIDILKLRFNRGLIRENEYREQLETLEKAKKESTQNLENKKFEINHLDVELNNSKKDVKNAESVIAQIQRRNEERINGELKLYNNYNSQKLHPSEKLPYESEQQYLELLKTKAR